MSAEHRLPPWLESREASPVVGEPRTFVSSAGLPCRISEWTAPPESWARGRTYLRFECENVLRRIWRFPPDWQSLSDAELEALSERL